MRVTPGWLQELVSAFGSDCRDRLAGPGEREAALRGPLDRLITAIGSQFELSVVMHDEVRDPDRRVRPDYGVQVAGAITGYLEVKKPEQSIDPDTFRGHNRRQWRRQQDLPNLLYTNGTEWRRYLDGRLVGDPVHFTGGRLDDAGDGLTCPPQFETLMRGFLDWEPAPITSVGRLVRAVAPLTRLLRGDVVDQLAAERRAVRAGADEKAQPFLGLASDWRTLLFPDATDERFADGYAQTVTFALLLATSDGIEVRGTNLHAVGDALRANHSLMGRALQLLTDQVATEFRVSLELLVRVIAAIGWDRIRGSRRDTYLYLYEDFLEAYDPDLRQQSGSYYTPRQVVEQMVRLTEDVLVDRLGRPRGFLDPDVVTVDPAMGTGTYLHAVIDACARRIARREGTGAVASAVTDLADRLVGFELQTGPYAVAELRTTDMLRKHRATPPTGGMRTFVTNTLDDPFVDVDQLASTLRIISESRRLANTVKAETPVTVVIGNPPYRERAEGQGGWVEAGDPAHGNRARPILDDFRAEGNGRVEYVLKNLYVYFWRWATWKVFDRHPADDEGVVCFISTNGYQRGPGFKGMREYLRRTTSEGWIIDLSPEGHQPDVSTRVFPGVQQTLSIGLFVRRGDVDLDQPAPVHYTAITGRRETKYQTLSQLTLDADRWRDARTFWQAPFTPAATSTWDDFPATDDLLPWAAPGIKPNRTWVYAPHPGVLRRRWETLTTERDADERARQFKPSRDSALDRTRPALPGVTGQPDRSIDDDHGRPLAPVQIGYRAFDRQWLIPDARLIDRARPDLWAARPPGQVFVVEQHSKPITDGPALLFTHLIPDMDHFKGSEGGRVLPLLHPNADPNLADRLSTTLSTLFDRTVDHHQVLAYVAAITAHPGFTIRFIDELTTPGVRVPVTADPTLWDRAVTVGAEVLWLHTYGHAYDDPVAGRADGDIRLADDTGSQQPLCREAVTTMPTGPVTYDPQDGRLGVGDGSWKPVTQAVRDYTVGGRNVLDSWVGYRRANPAGKKSSPLNQITTTTWPAEWTTELTDLLTALTRLVDLEPAQHALLDDVLAGRLLTRAELAANGVRWPDRDQRQPRYGEPENGRPGEQLMF